MSEDFKKSLAVENIIGNNNFPPMAFDEKVALSVYMGILGTSACSETEEKRKANFLLNINRIICNYDEVMNVLYKETHSLFDPNLSKKLEQTVSRRSWNKDSFYNY